ncbi:unnamed protein product [Didymodactylos carnosus]|nr:unnamed protein product [Didymodactylos carnosus]CAF3551723.1 unnamed protein product [Didymodactylos carnosus]
MTITQSMEPFSNVPPPPARPHRFYSRQQLKEYLQKVHEYYSIVGRPRFGRLATDLPDIQKTKENASSELLLALFDNNLEQIFDYLDMDKNGYITRREFNERLLK